MARLWLMIAGLLVMWLGHLGGTVTSQVPDVLGAAFAQPGPDGSEQDEPGVPGGTSDREREGPEPDSEDNDPNEWDGEEIAVFADEFDVTHAPSGQLHFAVSSTAPRMGVRARVPRPGERS